MMILRAGWMIAAALALQACADRRANLDSYVATMNAPPGITVAEADTRVNYAAADVEIVFEEEPRLDARDKVRSLIFVLAGPSADRAQLVATIAAACTQTREYSSTKRNLVRPITIVPVKHQTKARASGAFPKAGETDVVFDHHGLRNKSWLGGVKASRNHAQDVDNPNAAVGLLFVRDASAYDVFHALDVDQNHLNFQQGLVQFTSASFSEDDVRKVLDQAYYVPLDAYDPQTVAEIVKFALEKSGQGDIQTVRDTVSGLAAVEAYNEALRTILPGLSWVEGLMKRKDGRLARLSESGLRDVCAEGAS